MKKVAWFVFFLIIAVSCLNEPDCYQLNNNYIILNFRILGGGADAFVINTVKSPGIEQVLFADSITGGAALPLDPMANDTEFVFEGEGENKFKVSYLKQVQFVSSDCGERYTFSNLEIEDHSFDSIRVINTTPTRPASTNYEVYRCPRTEMVGIKFSAAATVTVKSISADYLTETYVVNGTIQNIALPLNTRAKTTAFTFDMGDNVKKKLTVKYDTIPETKYPLCGKQNFITNLTATTDFALAKLLTDSIHDLPVSNFEITP
ncbi:MAG: DUF6452 family protein [Chryseolinea sp.]